MERVELENAKMGLIKLGAQLENPYSVENMQKAWDNLKKSGANNRILGNEIEVRPTHRYVKFMPKSEADLDHLKRDTTLILYSYPLDYAMEEGGVYYHDPSVPAGQPTYQYASVKANKTLPNIPSEQLAELYIPEEDEKLYDNKVNAKPSINNLVKFLVEEALLLTNNLDDNKFPANGRIQASSWRPAGRIQLFDNSLNALMPVHGARVRARRWFTTHTGTTNSTGHFTCNGTFERDANYSIVWEQSDYDIRSGELGQAIFNGPQITGNWNLDISSGQSRMYAIVHQAAYNYYYVNRLGMKQPPLNSFWKASLKIAVWDEPNADANGSHCKDCRFMGMSSVIRIWRNAAMARDTYGTALHELAHASHWELRRNNWSNVDDRVQESWARGVQRALGRLRYPQYVPPYFGIYTGLVPDLVDPADASGHDRVTGYTMKQIEDVLPNTSNFAEWANNLRTNYTNSTSEHLPRLFSFWLESR